jgi:hypothetical protein
MPSQELEHFPAFIKLCRQIDQKLCSRVYIDFHDSQGYMPSPLDILPQILTDLGAKVINVSYDEDNLVAHHLKEEFGEDAHWHDVTDASDLVAFFPALAADILRASLHDELREEQKDFQRVEYRISRLAEANPYVAGRFPLVNERLIGEWQTSRREKQELRNKQRKQSGEQLFQLGPRHVGYLIDEDLSPYENARSATDLAWAESRVCKELNFTKVVSGQLVSYQRTVDEYDIFADIRIPEKIIFYIYGQEEKKSRKLESHPCYKDFSLQDRWKKDIAAKWMEAVREELRK